MFSSYASRKSCSEITVWMPWPLNHDLGGGAKWPSNHFRLYTARCICTEAQEMRAPCIFDWQGTQTFFSRWKAKSQIRSLVCTLRNSNIAITSLVCTLRKSKCAIQMIIQITHFAPVWKQSKSRNESHNKVLAFMGHPRHSTEIVAWGNAWAEKNTNWRCSRDYDSMQIEALGEWRRKETNKLMFQLGFVGGC